MVGMMLWAPPGHGLRPIRLKERSIAHTRFLCTEIPRGVRTPEAALRRRITAAGNKLARQGVERVVLSGGMAADSLPPGLRTVSTLPLRRLLAADWADALLRRRDGALPSAPILVTAAALSGPVVRTVTELALRHRYLLLEVPFGGEELAGRLRREFGVSILLNPTAEQAETAAIQVAFDPAADRCGLCLPLYDETLPLPALLLPQAVEEALPPEADRGQLLSVLLESGALRPGQAALRLGGEE